MVSVDCGALASNAVKRCVITCILWFMLLMAAIKTSISVGCRGMEIWVLCAGGDRRESSVRLEEGDEAEVDWENVALVAWEWAGGGGLGPNAPAGSLYSTFSVNRWLRGYP